MFLTYHSQYHRHCQHIFSYFYKYIPFPYLEACSCWGSVLRVGCKCDLRHFGSVPLHHNGFASPTEHHFITTASPRLQNTTSSQRLRLAHRTPLHHNGFASPTEHHHFITTASPRELATLFLQRTEFCTHPTAHGSNTLQPCSGGHACPVYFGRALRRGQEGIQPLASAGTTLLGGVGETAPTPSPYRRKKQNNARKVLK